MSSKMKKIGISDMSCNFLFYSCDWTESENFNFKKICYKSVLLCDDDNWNVYKLLL
jgi:hypothetical protein